MIHIGQFFRSLFQGNEAITPKEPSQIISTDILNVMGHITSLSLSLAESIHPITMVPGIINAGIELVELSSSAMTLHDDVKSIGEGYRPLVDDE